eukprot:3225427-Rhodomonas_salina.2
MMSVRASASARVCLSVRASAGCVRVRGGLGAPVRVTCHGLGPQDHVAHPKRARALRQTPCPYSPSPSTALPTPLNFLLVRLAAGVRVCVLRRRGADERECARAGQGSGGRARRSGWGWWRGWQRRARWTQQTSSQPERPPTPALPSSPPPAPFLLSFLLFCVLVCCGSVDLCRESSTEI